jgi:Raf kinase inhibitor-like YbhB/YbcL family protein
VGNWSHWVLWDIDPTARALEEGSTAGASGHSDFRRLGYGGPCPPKGHGPHRYFFKVYALDVTLDLPESSKKKQLEKAMEGHVLAKGELMGRYERN